MNTKLSVVIPAYNEEERLPLTLKEAVSYLEAQAIDYELIIVSDGSRDRTEEIVCQLSSQNHRIQLLTNQLNMGKGYSVRKGILASRGEYILFMDADNSTPIAELPKFLQSAEKYDILIGSRDLPESKIIRHQNWVRESIGKLFNKAVQLFFLPGIWDSQCGFKLFKQKAAMDIFKRAKVNRFVFDVEILYLARKLDYKILEVPITWQNSKPSKVSFFRDFFNIIFDLIKIKLQRIPNAL